MSQKMMNPNVTIWWVSTDPTVNPTPYDPDNPKASYLTDSVNISGAIDNGYTLGPTKSDTDKSKNITESANTESRVAYNYDAKLTFFREGDLTLDGTASAYARAFEFFKSGIYSSWTQGYLVRRIGYKYNVAAAAGQKVESYLVALDNPMDDAPDKATIKFAVNFKQQGKMSLFKTLA